MKIMQNIGTTLRNIPEIAPIATAETDMKEGDEA